MTHKPIYPKIDGGTVAMESFLKTLIQTGANLKHLLIHTPKHPFQLDSYPIEISKLIKPEAVFVDTTIKISKALGSLLKKESYNVNRFYSNEFNQLLQSTISNNEFDCIILESLFTTPYIEKIRKLFSGKVFIRTHNVENEIWKNLASGSTGIKNLYLKKLAKDLKSYEINTYNSADGLLSISEDDTEKLKSLGITSRITTINVAIDISNRCQHDYSKINLFHIGSMNWQPNIEAVDRLLSIFPTIKKEFVDIELHIAGKLSNDNYKSDIENGIYFDGYVEDLESYCSNQGILVTPIVSGSGVRIKILEMMALGIPVITSEKGAQGINYKANELLALANTDEELIYTCQSLIVNEKRRKLLGQAGFEYIQKNHDIKSISKQLLEYIKIK